MPKKIRIDFKDGSHEDVEYPTDDEIKRLNAASKKLVEHIFEDLEQFLGKEPR